MNYTLHSLFGRPYTVVNNWIDDRFTETLSFFTPINLVMILVLVLFLLTMLVLLVKRVSA